jgi:hypothetical protein
MVRDSQGWNLAATGEEMTHEQLMELVSNPLTESHNGFNVALHKIVDLHRPITTKKGSDYSVNCMTCIVASHNGGWKNRKYPCPTIEIIMKEVA